jgi:hypothetical protein
LQPFLSDFGLDRRSGSPFSPAVCIFPTTVAPNEMVLMQSRRGCREASLVKKQFPTGKRAPSLGHDSI